MQLNEVLSALKQTEASHLKLKEYAASMIAGAELLDEMTPVNATACSFDRWYQIVGQSLQEFPSYTAIEHPHRMVHQYYREIYELVYAKDDRSTLEKLFASDESFQKEQAEKAKVVASRLAMELDVFHRALQMFKDEVTLYSKKGTIDPNLHYGSHR